MEITAFENSMRYSLQRQVTHSTCYTAYGRSWCWWDCFRATLRGWGHCSHVSPQSHSWHQPNQKSTMSTSVQLEGTEVDLQSPPSPNLSDLDANPSHTYTHAHTQTQTPHTETLITSVMGFVNQKVWWVVRGDVNTLSAFTSIKKGGVTTKGEWLF